MVPPRKKLAWMKNFADVEAIKTKILIYPTDTVYGIGCNAGNTLLVERIFAIKRRAREKPMSVIAPGKEWILEHCIVKPETLDKYLPGKYTLILKKKDLKFLNEVTVGQPTLGVRIPAHRIAKLVEEARIPFVTTSANRSGERAPRMLGEIPEEIRRQADIVIDDGTLDGKPSTIVDCTGEREVILERQ